MRATPQLAVQPGRGRHSATRSTQTECDVLVAGSGAGGLATAVAARVLGLDVIVAEKSAQFGGTTAWSGGWLWIPCNPHALRAGIRDDIELARAYLRHELGAHFDAHRVDAFLRDGPRMVAFFERETALRFVPGLATPDFHGDSPGAGIGRTICAAPFDARELGGLIGKLRPPLAEITLAGMGIAAGTDLQHFLRAARSPRSAWYVARRLARHMLDLARHGRGMHLVNGNALVARLLKSASERGVRLWADAPVERLVMVNGSVRGAWLRTPDGPLQVTARRGVVLACGGFPHDVARRAMLFPHAPTGREHWSAASPDNRGDGLAMAQAAGASLDTTMHSPAAWCPVSEVPHRTRPTGRFPHLIDRARPGVIAVTRAGQRFVNEASSYHDFIEALLRVTAANESVEAFLVADHRALRRYGLGIVKPFPMPIGRWLRSGYLRRAATIDGLAVACGIDRVAMTSTIDEYNRHARDGKDPAYGRGLSAFNRAGGDPLQAPNPCVAPIESGPYYAIRVLPGSLGTFAGIRTDASARALRADGTVVAGLYAVGNDMASVMGGFYPGGGITLGPAMTFGYIAAHDLAGASVRTRRADRASIVVREATAVHAPYPGKN